MYELKPKLTPPLLNDPDLRGRILLLSKSKPEKLAVAESIYNAPDLVPILPTTESSFLKSTISPSEVLRLKIPAVLPSLDATKRPLALASTPTVLTFVEVLPTNRFPLASSDSLVELPLLS